MMRSATDYKCDACCSTSPSPPYIFTHHHTSCWFPSLTTCPLGGRSASGSVAFHQSQSGGGGGRDKVQACRCERPSPRWGFGLRAEEPGRKLEGKSPGAATGSAEAATGDADRQGDARHEERERHGDGRWASSSIYVGLLKNNMKISNRLMGCFSVSSLKSESGAEVSSCLERCRQVMKMYKVYLDVWGTGAQRPELSTAGC